MLRQQSRNEGIPSIRTRYHQDWVLISVKQAGNDKKTRKSKGLHRNEDWEWAQAATKSCGRNVLLPTADHQRCSISASKSMDLHQHGNENWDSNELPPNFGGALCSCPHRCRPPTLNTDKGRLCQIGASHVAKQGERHHFCCLQIAARNAHILFDSFNFFDFSILNPIRRYASTTTHFFDILIHVVAYHSRSKAPKLIQTWFPHVAVATSLSLTL